MVTQDTWVMRTTRIYSSLISLCVVSHCCRYRAALALMEEESELVRQQDEASYQSLEDDKSSHASAGSPNLKKIAIYGRLQSRSTPWGRAASSGSLTDADDLTSKVSLHFVCLDSRQSQISIPILQQRQNPKPQALNSKPSTLNPQPSTLNPQPPTLTILNPQP